MASPPPSSSVADALRGRNVFITGATGFVGKVLVEKLLRSTPVNKIFCLVRARKGSSARERLMTEVIASRCFDRMRSEFPDFDNIVATRVIAVAGCLTMDKVGLSPEDQALVHANVNIVLHCAASLDFEERIDRAVDLNVFGSLRMLEMAHACKKMDLFMHVSTCYVNSNRR